MILINLKIKTWRSTYRSIPGISSFHLIKESFMLLLKTGQGTQIWSLHI